MSVNVCLISFDRSTGKVRGSGIYFASNANTSLGYCVNRGNTILAWRNSLFSDHVQCIALCEIIDNKKEFTHSVCVHTHNSHSYSLTPYLLILTMYEGGRGLCGAS